MEVHSFSAFSQAIYFSALSFMSHMCRAQRSARCERLGCSLAFSKHGSNPGHVCAPLDSLVYVEPFKVFITPCIFLPAFPSQIFFIVYCVPVCYPLHQEVVSLIFPFKWFWQTLSRRRFQSGQNKGKPLSQSFRESPDMSNHVITVPWEQSPYYPLWYQETTPGTWTSIPIDATNLGSGG